MSDLAAAADQELRLSEIQDYPHALNGLQLENRGEVHKIAAAVDASLPVIKKAVACQANLLVVHHGLFWQGLQPHTGASLEKLRLAIDHDLAIYSAHLPLDVHPTLGNNAQLWQALGLSKAQPFFPWKGLPLGLRGSTELALSDLLERLTEVTGARPHLAPGGPSQVRELGLMTGGAGSEVGAVAEQGVDTFVTGEGPHWSHPLAEELGVNLIYAGHYATETFGVKALAQWWSEHFSLEWTFLDHPTGL
ncbi:MAG: Nif3-like dinuclear metal center hexameric protein [Verrucomicrobiota bacterium]